MYMYILFSFFLHCPTHQQKRVNLSSPLKMKKLRSILVVVKRSMTFILFHFSFIFFYKRVISFEKFYGAFFTIIISFSLFSETRIEFIYSVNRTKEGFCFVFGFCLQQKWKLNIIYLLYNKNLYQYLKNCSLVLTVTQRRLFNSKLIFVSSFSVSK